MCLQCRRQIFANSCEHETSEWTLAGIVYPIFMLLPMYGIHHVNVRQCGSSCMTVNSWMFATLQLLSSVCCDYFSFSTDMSRKQMFTRCAGPSGLVRFWQPHAYTLSLSLDTWVLPPWVLETVKRFSNKELVKLVWKQTSWNVWQIKESKRWHFLHSVAIFLQVPQMRSLSQTWLGNCWGEIPAPLSCLAWGACSTRAMPT